MDTLSEGERYTSENMNLSFQAKCVSLQKHVSEHTVRKDIADFVTSMDYLQVLKLTVQAFRKAP